MRLLSCGRYRYIGHMQVLFSILKLIPLCVSTGLRRWGAGNQFSLFGLSLQRIFFLLTDDQRALLLFCGPDQIQKLPVASAPGW